MKLNKVLTINGQVLPLVRDEVRLDLRNPGRATFLIQAPKAVSGLVSLDMGYNDDPLQRHFLGYVERCTSVNSQEQTLFCRELTGVLAQPMPMALRHVDLRQVMAHISKQSGLSFRVPEAAYAREKAPFFYSLASGFQALDSLAQVFGIPDFIWHQESDGKVFVGRWGDSCWGARPALQLPAQLLDQHQSNQSATVAALPGLRPGVLINQNERVISVTLVETQMAIKWKQQ